MDGIDPRGEDALERLWCEGVRVPVMGPRAVSGRRAMSSRRGVLLEDALVLERESGRGWAEGTRPATVRGSDPVLGP